MYKFTYLLTLLNKRFHIFNIGLKQSLCWYTPWSKNDPTRLLAWHCRLSVCPSDAVHCG